ncbi:ArsR/SmtB family transcription factor [Phreatobacter oligotrophus]|uniref:ArsR/SmtB family transcription factor n=1 Tax=Phreatobacter oligotrophus TaxID=1122261 RepID=UPI0023568DE2|nr:metalloregulator ArsR/SmtB family transcription factor [Phreatobacter oligotrophus]MBX9992956.1 metalloregulator ArsR/SmtB family transcription factor [Phreatobacter oligotrophus]
MDENDAIASLAALAQPTRLATFRLLVAQEPEGIAAGEIGRMLGVVQNTMSAHLSVLTRAGLVRSERRGRVMIYHAELDHFRAVALYLVDDCCGGRSEICAPLLERLSPCCTPATRHDP